VLNCTVHTCQIISNNDDDDEYDNFYGTITQHMPLQGCLDKNPYNNNIIDPVSKLGDWNLL